MASVLQNKIILILAMAIILRVSMFFIMPLRSSEHGNPKKFDLVAKNVYTGNGYSLASSPPYVESTHIEPTYVFFLAGIYSLLGYNHDAVRIIQIAVDVFTCILIYLISFRLFGEDTAIPALLLTSLNPFFAVYALSLLTVSLHAFLVTLSAFVFIRGGEGNRTVYFVFAGALIGLILLCRAESIFLPFYIIGIILLKYGRQSFRKVAALAVGLFLVISPWSIRNYTITGKIGVATIGGFIGDGLYFTTIQEFFGNDVSQDRLIETEHKEFASRLGKAYAGATSPEERKEIQDILFRMAFKRIMSDPLGYLWKRLINYPKLWIGIHPDEFIIFEQSNLRMFRLDMGSLLHSLKNLNEDVVILVLKYGALSLSVFYFLFGVIGLWVNRNDFMRLAYLYIFIIFIAINYFPTLTETRYSVPVTPILMIFAASGMNQIALKRARLREFYEEC